VPWRIGLGLHLRARLGKVQPADPRYGAVTSCFEPVTRAFTPRPCLVIKCAVGAHGHGGGVVALAHPLGQQCSAIAKSTGERCERRCVATTVWPPSPDQPLPDPSIANRYVSTWRTPRDSPASCNRTIPIPLFYT
jgi:hypothetical protein